MGKLTITIVAILSCSVVTMTISASTGQDQSRRFFNSDLVSAMCQTICESLKAENPYSFSFYPIICIQKLNECRSNEIMSKIDAMSTTAPDRMDEVDYEGLAIQYGAEADEDYVRIPLKLLPNLKNKINNQSESKYEGQK